MGYKNKYIYLKGLPKHGHDFFSVDIVCCIHLS